MIGTTSEIDLADMKIIIEHATLNLAITTIRGAEDQDQGKPIDVAEVGVGIEREGYLGDHGQDRGIQDIVGTEGVEIEVRADIEEGVVKEEVEKGVEIVIKYMIT